MFVMLASLMRALHSFRPDVGAVDVSCRGEGDEKLKEKRGEEDDQEVRETDIDAQTLM